MTSATNVSSEVGKRYANALIELAESAKTLDKVEQDLKALKAMVEDSADLAGAIRSPLIDQGAMGRVVEAISEKAGFQTVTKNFLGVLVKNRRLFALGEIIGAFTQALAARRGELTVNVQVAQDLTAAQKKDLQAALSKAIGAEVTVRATVEPSILGGMIVTVGSRMIDDSVRRKLERLRVTIGGSANENSTSQTTKSSNLK